MPTGKKDAIGTVRRRADANYIKVSDTGPRVRQWQQYSRWLWETTHGPVPAGMRVLRKDGDVHNDDIRNLVLGSAADNLWLHCHSDEEKSNRNYDKCRKATADLNRLRGHQNRQLNWLRNYWYAVNEATGEVLNEPQRSAIGVARLLQIDCPVGAVWSHVLGDPGGSKMSAIVLRCLSADRLTNFEELNQSIGQFCNRCEFRTIRVETLRSVLSGLRRRELIVGPRGRYCRTITSMPPLFIVRGRQLDRHFPGVERISAEILAKQGRAFAAETSQLRF